MPSKLITNTEGKLEWVSVDWEGQWLEKAEYLCTLPKPSHKALMEHFYGNEISEYMYDDPDCSDGFWRQHHNLHSKYCELFKDKLGIDCIFDIYLLFKNLGYEVDSVNREMFYGHKTEEKRMDLYIRNPENNSSLSFVIDVRGTWEIRASCLGTSTLGVPRTYDSWADLLTQLQFFFNLLMGTDHDLQERFEAFDQGEVLAEGWKEDKDIRDAIVIQKEEDERNRKFTQALCNAHAYMTGATEAPFPEEV